jgi:hypothetical protein
MLTCVMQAVNGKHCPANHKNDMKFATGAFIYNHNIIEGILNRTAQARTISALNIFGL